MSAGVPPGTTGYYSSFSTVKSTLDLPNISIGASLIIQLVDTIVQSSAKVKTNPHIRSPINSIVKLFARFPETVQAACNSKTNVKVPENHDFFFKCSQQVCNAHIRSESQCETKFRSRLFAIIPYSRGQKTCLEVAVFLSFFRAYNSPSPIVSMSVPVCFSNSIICTPLVGACLTFQPIKTNVACLSPQSLNSTYKPAKGWIV